MDERENQKPSDFPEAMYATESPAGPQENATSKERDFWITSCLQIANALQKALGLNEATYLGVAGHALPDARTYYLYGAMDEVTKASTAMLRWNEFIGDPGRDKDKPIQTEDAPHMMRLVKESVFNEQDMWVRKLTEILCDMILFATTNDQNHYRLYLTCQQLDAYLGLQLDFKEFFECENLNARSTISMLFDDINRIGQSVDVNKVWFLRSGLRRDASLRPGFIFRSARDRFRLAVERATADQRLTLGMTYHNSFGVSSWSLHPNIGGPSRAIDQDHAMRNFRHVASLAQHVGVLGHELGGIKPTGYAALVGKIISGKSDATRLVESRYAKILDPGDIVFAYGTDVCQVLERKETKYGYTSYKVRYLIRPPLQEVPEDWFPARYVHLIFPRRGLREKLIEIYRQVGASPETSALVENMSDELLTEKMADLMRSLHQSGELEQMIEAMMKGKSASSYHNR